MNFGAKNNDPSSYNLESMEKDVSPSKIEDSSIKNMILRDIKSALEWYENRGNAGDNVNIETFEEFHTCIIEENAEKAVIHAHTILENRMHPTASDIMKSPIKQFCYNVCGKRTYNYKEN